MGPQIYLLKAKEHQDYSSQCGEENMVFTASKDQQNLMTPFMFKGPSKQSLQALY